MRTGLNKGVGSGLAAAALFGISAPFAKLLLRDISPQLLAGMLYVGSGSGLSVLWVLQRHRSHGSEAALTRKDFGWLTGAIAFGGVLGPLFLMLGLARTAGSAASLLLNLEGVFTALLAWFVFRENFDRRIALGMAAIVAGSLLLSWQGQLSLRELTGPLAVVAACLCWAIDNNLTQKVSAADPVQIAMLKGLVAGIVNVSIAFALQAHWPPAAKVGYALLLGFVSYGLSLVFFVLALRQLGTARTGAYFSIAPFVGASASLLIFRERPGAFLLAAALLMGVGVWLHLSEHHAHEHLHEVLDHEHPHVHAPLDDHHQHLHSDADPSVSDPVPHTHAHHHERMRHNHQHYPDIHHRHNHDHDHDHENAT